MARSVSIDLRKIGEKLPGGVRRAMGRGAKVVAKPLAVADTIAHPEELLDPVADKVANPIVSGRVKRCTIATRAHILGIADLPALGYEHGGHVGVTLFRVRVERPGGDAETCVRQHFPNEIRRVAPGSSVRALAHEEDPRYVVLDWRATSQAMGMELTWPGGLDQYAWPGQEEWPALNAIEVRDTGRYTRKLAERRATWTPARAALTLAKPTGGFLNDRQQVTIGLDLGGRLVTLKERMPDLAIAKLVGWRESGTKLGGMVTSYESIANVGAPIAVLVSPSGEVAVDWEATLNQPEMRATEQL